MEYFTGLKFAQSKSRRRRTLSDVMPVGEDWSYFVVLSDAYLTTNTGETHIRSFGDLQGAMSCGDSLQAVQTVRASGKLTEGRHELPDAVASCLSKHGSEFSSIRQWFFGVAEPVMSTFSTSELAGVWSGQNVEEIEVVDQSARWYFRMKHDEALIFLAIRGSSLAERIKHCKTYCCETNGGFEYAL